VNGGLRDLVVIRDDPPLAEAVRAFIAAHADERANARASWVVEPNNFSKLVRLYRERGLSADTERRELTGVLAFVGARFGDEARKALRKAVRLRSSGRRGWRTRWLSGNEIARIRESSGDWWIVVGTAVATGLRAGELLSLRVRDLDFEAGTLVVQAGKSVKARRVLPLGGEILGMLRGWVAAHDLEPGDRLFEVTKRQLRRAWERIREDAGLHDVRFHDLRHTYAVWCAKSGMPLVELQQRLGHATITMTQRYAVYAPPTASVHYDAALKQMGLGGDEAPDVPTVVPTPPLDEEAAPEPEGPEAASRQGGGGGIPQFRCRQAPEH
jgi:integrase